MTSTWPDNTDFPHLAEILVHTPSHDELKKSQSTVNGSNDDPHRQELMWEDREELLVDSIRAESVLCSKQQMIAGKRKKRLFAFWVMAATVVPLVAGVVLDLQPTWLNVNTFLLKATSLCVFINGFFNYGGQSQKHFDYSNKYDDIVLAVRIEMCKPKAFREACDVFLERLQYTYKAVNAQAPLV